MRTRPPASPVLRPSFATADELRARGPCVELAEPTAHPWTTRLPSPVMLTCVPVQAGDGGLRAANEALRAALATVDSERVASARTAFAQALRTRLRLRTKVMRARPWRHDRFAVVAPVVSDAAVAPDACGLPRGAALAAYAPLVLATYTGLDGVLAAHAAVLRRAGDDGVPVMLRATLVEGGAVRVHPTVAALLADGRDLFDVVVRGTWSAGADADREAIAPWRMARELTPRTHTHPVGPSARLGLWLLTRDGAVDGARTYANGDELSAAWEQGEVAHDARVRARIDGCSGETTAGRVWLWRALPVGVRFAAVNCALDAEALVLVVSEMTAGLDAQARWSLLAALEDAGTRWLARSGASVGMDDLRPSEVRETELAAARDKVIEAEANYADGLTTDGERYNRVVDLWVGATQQCAEALRKTTREPLASWRSAGLLPARYGALYLVDGRGLIAKPSGETEERPVLGSAGGGFGPFDLGTLATKERAELMRAEAHITEALVLTRTLARSVGMVRVTLADCGVTPHDEELRWRRIGPSWRPLPDRGLGRVLAAEVRWPDGALLAAAGAVIDQELATLLDDAQASTLRVVPLRSPRSCLAAEGVCARCWGDGVDGAPVAVGERVGARAVLELQRVLPTIHARLFHIC